MTVRYVLLSNNPLVKDRVSRESLRFIEGNSWDVLTEGRDLIHRGARLLTHPRYGNFYPNQQPYRSLLIEENPADRTLHMDSLNLLEEALAVWREYEGRVALPGEHGTGVDGDYARIDLSLMKESLIRYGLWLGIEA